VVIGRAVMIGCFVIAAQAVDAEERRNGAVGGGLTVEPSVTIVQLYDSNLFASGGGQQSDLITRIQPTIQSAYGSKLWDLGVRSTFDIERFARHRELTTADAGRDLSADLQYRPTRRLRFAAGAGFAKTHSPSDLDTLSGLVFGRRPASRISAHTSMTTELQRPTTGRLEYRFSDDRLAGASRIQSHSAAAGVDHRLASREMVTVETRVDQFAFQSPGLEPSAATSLTIVFGWTHTLARGMNLSIDGGPRATNGSLAPELAAAIQVRRNSGSASLAYARTQTPVLGLPGVAAAHSVAATAGWRLGRSLDVVVSPSFVRSALGMWRADSGRLAIDINRRLAPGVSLAFAGAAGVQRGNLRTDPRGTIARNEIRISVMAGRPHREASADER
jgi:hypothetical protein